MNDSKVVQNFKSYIKCDENELESLSLNEQVKLLAGESIAAEANNVILVPSMCDKNEGITGGLTVTNFRLSFIKYEDNQADTAYQQNLLLGQYEVCLANIDAIYQIGDRRKYLSPGQSVPGKIKGLYIVCKNMRTFQFNFKNSSMGKGRSVANALLHHAFPRRHSLLFAFDYDEEYYNSCSSEIMMFTSERDWKKELDRTKCSKHWRISSANACFFQSNCLPKAVVVSNSVLDSQLSQAAEHFQNRIYPVWVWGTKKGAALVRSADLLPTITDRTQENIMLENVRKSHAEKRQPILFDLTKDCPNPKEIRASYLKLRDLCTPESDRQFWLQDNRFFSSLENSRWLYNVSVCLAKSAEAAELLLLNNTVVLQEASGHDLCCVVSSLTQLLLDPHYRTLNGFQSLIQKDWVAMGHPFCKRLGLVHSQEAEQSPVFLLFLDCVWQLLNQCPRAFAFTETFLTTIWDSVHITVFETFLFNSEHDRHNAKNDRNSKFKARSVWDWREQFADKDIELFNNPLFDVSFTHPLEPRCSIPFLEMWEQCYFRWIPQLEITNGGKVQADLFSRNIKSEIFALEQALLQQDRNGVQNNHFRDESSERTVRVNSFFPFTSHSGQQTGIQGVWNLNTTILSGDGLADSQSIMTVQD